MDTVARGNAFEDAIFELVKKELMNDRLELFRSQAKIFKKRGISQRTINLTSLLTSPLKFGPEEISM